MYLFTLYVKLFLCKVRGKWATRGTPFNGRCSSSSMDISSSSNALAILETWRSRKFCLNYHWWLIYSRPEKRRDCLEFFIHNTLWTNPNAVVRMAPLLTSPVFSGPHPICITLGKTGGIFSACVIANYPRPYRSATPVSTARKHVNRCEFQDLFCLISFFYIAYCMYLIVPVLGSNRVQHPLLYDQSIWQYRLSWPNGLDRILIALKLS